ncbi:MAG: EamA family transporter, partial [Solobacterium sp.]|nr:EamA family transporter [Solobacterium sp.]
VLITGGLKASLLSTFEPLTSLFIGVIVFHELLTVHQWIGIVLVLVSVILLVIPVGAKKES